MNEMTRLIQSHDYLTPRIAGKSGVSKFKFYKYVRENGLEQVGRGIYSASENWPDELYVLHQRCPNAVFSHDEAFYYYDLTDRDQKMMELCSACSAWPAGSLPACWALLVLSSCVWKRRRHRSYEAESET